ncbi:MAG: transglutaminase domain-containing protein [Anaerolineales bacterium]|nr:transglutaminase domain-containing protein [Anaerolineales bacterium]
MLLIKVWRWFVRKVGAYTLWSIGLLFLALSSVAYGYADFLRGIGPVQLNWLALLGVVLGWAVGRSRMRGVLAFLFLLALGLVLDLLLLADLFQPLWTWFRAALGVVVTGLQPDISPDLGVLRFAGTEVELAITKVAAEVGGWLRTLFAGAPSFNLTAVSLLWGFVLWLVASWAGFVQRRFSKPLLAILPAGILLAAGLSYTRASTISLFPAVFALLTLIALSSSKSRTEFWEREQIDYPEDAGFEIVLSAVGITLSLLLVAIIVPRLTLRPIVNFVYRLTEGQIQQVDPVIQSLGLVQEAEDNAGFVTLGVAGLPRVHLLNSDIDLSEQLVMTVRMTAGIFPEEIETLGQPLYWRSLTYDQYLGSGWLGSGTTQRDYLPGELVSTTQLPNHRMVEHAVRYIAEDRQLVYAAGELVTLDTDFEVAFRDIPTGTAAFGYPGDHFGTLFDGREYKVRAWVPLASQAALRQSDGVVPGWILNRYLALPTGIPARVFALAQQVAQGHDNTFDRVRALEQYLRTFPYDLEVPEPPAGRDMVDYFLFDLQRGYCDYYASAMIVMARSIGIPARLAVGYAQGTYDRANDRYLVSEAEAHSWVEVYFPDIGWIPFEPTAGRPAIQRPQDIAEIPPALRDVSPDAPMLPWYAWWVSSWQRGLLVALLAGGLFLLAWFQFDAWWLYQFPAEQVLERLYRRLYRHGRRLGIRSQRGETPAEFSARLERRLLDLQEHARTGFDLHPAIEAIQRLTDLYTTSLYSSHPATRKEQWQSIDLWRRLRPSLVLARFFKFRIFRKKILARENGQDGTIR